MNERMSQSLKFIGIASVAGAITWALSWLLQYACSVTSTHKPFHLTSPEANRLAIATVIAVAAVVVAIMLLLALDGCFMLIALIIWGSAIVGGIAWWAHHAFANTAVSTQPAQIVYGILVALWGILLWYVFLPEAADTLSDILDEALD